MIMGQRFNRQMIIRAASAALVASGIVQVACAQLVPPVTEATAAGAIGKPLICAAPRADLGIPFNDALWNIHIGGHIEGSWAYNVDPFHKVFQNGQFVTFTPTTPLRLFDFEHEDLTLNQVDLFLTRPVDPFWSGFDVGFKIEGMWGGDARLIHADGLFDHYQLIKNPNPSPGQPSEIFSREGGPDEKFDLTQAYLDVTIPIGNGARLRAGKVATPIGIESIDPTVSPLYDRGLILQLLLPKTLTGAWLAYRLIDDWMAEVGVI